MPYPCPYCQQELHQLERPTVVTCPRCFESFRMPARCDWSIAVLGILAINLCRLWIMG